jgi:hypothetical protein
MVSNLALLFCLATVWATFQKIGRFFYKSSGHPGSKLECSSVGAISKFVSNFASTLANYDCGASF